jgi:hypothetical protein
VRRVELLYTTRDLESSSSLLLTMMHNNAVCIGDVKVQGAVGVFAGSDHNGEWRHRPAPLMHGPTLSKLVLTWVALDCPALYTPTTSSYFCATSPITLASAASLPSRTGGPAMIVALAQPVVSNLPGVCLQLTQCLVFCLAPGLPQSRASTLSPKVLGFNMYP